ncbi:MAG: response regulator [Candidatus Brocadiia bacterium]
MQTILIAEDWSTLRERLDARLRQTGYFTLLAETAEEALGLLRSFQVDLLVARERLPDMEGSTLAALLRRRGLEEMVVVLQAEDAAAEGACRGGAADAVVSRSVEVEPVVRLIRRLLRPVTVHASPSAGLDGRWAGALA